MNLGMTLDRHPQVNRCTAVFLEQGDEGLLRVLRETGLHLFTSPGQHDVLDPKECYGHRPNILDFEEVSEAPPAPDSPLAQCARQVDVCGLKKAVSGPSSSNAHDM